VTNKIVTDLNSSDIDEMQKPDINICIAGLTSNQFLREKISKKNLFNKSREELTDILDAALKLLRLPRSITLEVIRIPNSMNIFSKTM